MHPEFYPVLKQSSSNSYRLCLSMHFTWPDAAHISPNEKSEYVTFLPYHQEDGATENQQQQIQFKPNTPNTPNAGRAFSLSHAIFLSMMILVCTYNVICCVVHEHFVVFDYFIYFVSEQTASYPIALEKLSIRYLSTSVSRSAYNVTATMWLATAPQKEKSIATLWFFITVMQFLNGLLNIILCNFTNERNCSNSPSSIRWFQ